MNEDEIYQEFKENLSTKLFLNIDTSIKKIKDEAILKRFKQCIKNYNFYKRIKENSGEYQGMKFLYLCISVEAFYNYNEKKYDENTKNFVDFFSNLSENNIKLLKEKFKIIDFSDKELSEKFGNFIYKQRSFFLHQGIFFECCPEDCVSNIYILSENKSAYLDLKLREFEELFLDALENKIKNMVLINP